MEQLSDEQQQTVRKMSTERIQGRLMRAGLDEELVYSLGRQELMEELSKTVLLAEDAAAAEGGERQLSELEIRLMELNEREKQRQLEQAKLEQEQNEPKQQRELEQAKLEQAKVLEQAILVLRSN